MNAILLAILGTLAILVGLALAVGCYGLGGIIFSWFWNWLAPLAWHSAPHISWFAGFIGGSLLGLAQLLLVRVGK